MSELSQRQQRAIRRLVNDLMMSRVLYHRAYEYAIEDGIPDRMVSQLEAACYDIPMPEIGMPLVSHVKLKEIVEEAEKQYERRSVRKASRKPSK